MENNFSSNDKNFRQIPTVLSWKEKCFYSQNTHALILNIIHEIEKKMTCWKPWILKKKQEK